MRCLVIGGAGFMGRSITRALSAEGLQEVTVVDLPEREKILAAAPNVTFIPRNYLELDQHDPVFQGCGQCGLPRHRFPSACLHERY